MSFGEQLQEVRRSNGMTQEQFAEALQVSVQALSRWESGRSYPEVISSSISATATACPSARCLPRRIPLPTAETPAASDGGPAAQGQPVHLAGFFHHQLIPKSKWIGMGILVGVALLALLIGPVPERRKRRHVNNHMDRRHRHLRRGGGGHGRTGVHLVRHRQCGRPDRRRAGLAHLASGGGVLHRVHCGADRHAAAGEEAGQQGRHRYQRRPVLGGTARVTETIDNTIPSGEVYIDGKTWTARSESGAVIAPETLVKVIRLEGVKLYVDVPHNV